MTIEQVKGGVKKYIGEDITDELAQAIQKRRVLEELSAQELEEVTGGADPKIRYVNRDKIWSKLEPYVTKAQINEWMAARGSKELFDQELDNVAGGCGWFAPKHTRKVCPACGSENLEHTCVGNSWNNLCRDCGWGEGGLDY